MDFTAHENSDVATFFANKTVFLTGATGFIGKLIIEKLLRACPDVKRIFLVIRDKKQMTCSQRLDKLLEQPVFEAVLRRWKGCRSKLVPVSGDIDSPNLGLSKQDLTRVISESDVVIHCAASVKFNERLAAATRMNLIGTKNVIDLCHRMRPRLVSFVHVSTAYVNCNQPSGAMIEEKIYPSSVNVHDYLEVYSRLSPDAFEEAYRKPSSEFPNTYTFTKKLAEDLVNESGLPAVIVRPSIVVSSYQEPFPGWVDNLNGPVGFAFAVGLGVLQATWTDVNLKPDSVPSDFVVNCIIVAAYRRALGGFCNSDVPVIHACIGKKNCIDLKERERFCYALMDDYPTLMCYRYPYVHYCTSEFEYRLRMFLFHRIPMELADFGCRVVGKKTRIRELYTRLIDGIEQFHHFQQNDWDFLTPNTEWLVQDLSEKDQYVYKMHPIDGFDMEKYSPWFLLSIRFFIFKEDMSTLPAARKWRKALKLASYGSQAIGYFMATKVLTMTVESLFGIDVPYL